MNPKSALVFLWFALFGCLGFVQITAAAEQVNVFAAASLKNALDEVAAAWMKKTGEKVGASYAASSVLAKQIEQAAPADIFMPADLDWMDYLDRKGLIQRGSRKDLLGNGLMLVAPAGSSLKLDLKPGADLAGLLAGEKLAMGDVKSVPAGKYGKAALERLGLWNAVEKNIVMSDNVRAALAYVARGEARLGIVYTTDAKAEPKVEIAGVFPQDSHPAIIYPVALVKSGTNPHAAEFLAFLFSPEAAAIFTSQGFAVLP